MIRQIILVKGYSKDYKELNIDNFYTNCYYTFFKSIAGGAYDDEEIICINEPTIQQLRNIVAEKKPDFAILVFIGHGATQEDIQLFQVNENDIIKAGQLTLEVDKQIIILESCRTQIENVLTVDLTDKIPKFRYGGIIRMPLNREKAKSLYREQIIKCEKGIVICFACQKGEIAMNYYFSFAIIQVSFNWHLESGNHFQTWSITNIMDYISVEVPKFTFEKIKEIQTPEIIGRIDFPFVVSKF